MKRFDMEIQPQPYYMGEGESPLTVSPYESTNGDWVQWDDVQELEESHQRLLDALKLVLENDMGNYKTADEFGGYVLDEDVRLSVQDAISKSEGTN